MHIGRLLPVVFLAAPALANDSLFVQELDKLSPATPELFDLFGFALATSGDTLVVGAVAGEGVEADAGAAHVYEHNGNTWTFLEELTAFDGETEDQYATSFALDGDTLMVGARRDDDGAVDGGAVYVYVREATGWVFQSKLIANDPEEGDLFGWAIDLDGDTAIISAPSKDSNGMNSGAAYVFSRSGTTWGQDQKLVGSNTFTADQYGTSVAIEGDTIAIGALGTGANEGSVYIYTLVGAVWTQRVELAPLDPTIDKLFGLDVDLSGDALLVGAGGDDHVGTLAGAAYVFRGSGASWTEEAKIVAGDPAFGSFFGVTVSLDGDRAAVGSPQHSAAAPAAGAAYLFEKNGTAWTQCAIVTASDAAAIAGYGIAVEVEGDTFAVGAFQDDEGVMDAGAAYVYRVREVLASFCSGDGGDGAGCTDCPCANNALAGTIGGCLNTSGTSGRLVGSGNASLAADTLRFEALGLNPGTFALLSSADNALPNMGPCPPGSGVAPANLNGLRCIGGNLLRHGTRAIANDGSVGMGSTPGWGAPDGPLNGILEHGGFTVGQTRRFQIFYRDQQVACNADDVNTTNAGEITVTL